MEHHVGDHEVALATGDYAIEISLSATTLIIDASRINLASSSSKILLRAFHEMIGDK